MKAFARFTPSLLHSPFSRHLRNVTARRRPDGAQSTTTTPKHASDFFVFIELLIHQLISV